MTGEPFDAATIALLGGDPALDFANTIENRISTHPDDTLRTPDDLRAWGTRLGLLAGGGVRPPTAAELHAAVELRDHLIALLTAHVGRHPLPRRDLDALHAALADAWAHTTLSTDDTGLLAATWDPRIAATVRHRVAVAAFDLLSGPRADRVAQCRSAECGWFFLDTSKNHSRHWCSMRGCGNLAKTRRRRND